MKTKDLDRASFKSAEVVVVMCDKNTKDPIQNDYINVLMALSIKNHSFKHAKQTTRVIMQLVKPQSKQHYYNSLSFKSYDQLIIVDDIKLTLMAKSCFSKGIITFITNLITTSGEPGECSKVWIKEYAQGKTYELYRTKLSDKLEGMKFKDVVAQVYKDYKAIVIALEMSQEDNSIILLNPSCMKLTDIKQRSMHIYIICSNSDIADQISVMGKPKNHVAFQYAFN